MIIPKLPENEKDRLKELETYAILDSFPEQDYDNITLIASQICDTPISLITLIDPDRQWFKSHHGLPISETPRNYAFCAHAINSPNELFIINDSRLDERFHDNPIVTNDPNVVFYAGFPLVGDDGYPLGTLCVIDNKPRDLSPNQITTLKVLSNQVMNLLELRRTKMTLEKSLKDVNELNVELESFAHIAAHDLKSPLNNISGLADLFLNEYKEKLDTDAIGFIEMILTSSDKLKTLIDDLLRYSKSGKILDKGNSLFEVRPFFKDIKSLFSLQEKATISLKTDLGSIYSNKIALEQVFMNLISNAIKYNDKTELKVEIEIKENTENYIFTIEDNGSGIEEINYTKIFENFETLTTEDRYGEKGTGIGLALVKKIITTLDGEIKVTSVIGKGTKFTFTIRKNENV
jgi:signal transduction histidine kinase